MIYKAEKTNLVRNAQPPKEAKEAIDSFEDIWLRKHDRDQVLYHYTSAKGLKGILDNRSFWCTDVNFVNDALEIKYGRKIIKERLDSYLKSETDQNVQLALRILAEFTGNNIYDTYIACFSESGDILSQWNNYANKGLGYNLGIQFNNNQSLITKVSHYPDISSITSAAVLRKVFYDIDEQYYIVDGFISNIIEGTKKAAIRDDHVSMTWGADVAVYAFNLLLEIIFSLKSPSYQEEKEWRLVYMIDKNWKPGLRKFRVDKNNIVPYLNTYLYEDINGDYNFPIDSINLGPMLVKEISQKSLNIYLDYIKECSRHKIKIKNNIKTN